MSVVRSHLWAPFFLNLITYDNDYGNINPSKFFSNKSEILNRVWIGIGMNHTNDKVKLDLSSGTLDFDREALDDNRICAWSKFKV